MKKLTKVSAVLAAMVLAFGGLAACSSDDGNDNPPATKDAITGISLDKTTDIVEVNGTITLTATVAATGNPDKTVTWEVTEGNDKVELSATGNSATITGKAEGDAKITAKAGDKTATCDVAVKAEGSTVKVTVKINSNATGTVYTLEKNKEYTIAELCGLIGISAEDIDTVSPEPSEGKYTFANDTTLEITTKEEYTFDGWDADELLSAEGFAFINQGLTDATYTKKKDKDNPAKYEPAEAAVDGFDGLKAIHVIKEVDPTKDPATEAEVNYTNLYTTGDVMIDDVLGINSPSGRIRMRENGVLNFNGDKGRYLVLDTAALEAEGNLKITVNMTMTSAGKGGTVYMLKSHPTDNNGEAKNEYPSTDASNVIASKEDSATKGSDDKIPAFDFDATVAAGTKVYICYKRSDSSGGGVDINSITIEPAQ